MSADPEEVLYDAVPRGEPLQMGGRLEPAHLALSLAGRLVRDFGAIVRVLVRAVNHRRHHGTERRWVAAQLVRDQPARLSALSFQELTEEPLSRPLVPPRCHKDAEHVPVLVHGPPQILLPPLDLHEQLVQMAGVALAAPAVPQPPRVIEPEPQTPLPNRLVRHGDTALGEEILDVPETQVEPVIRRNPSFTTGCQAARPAAGPVY